MKKIKKIKVNILQCIWNGESIGIWNHLKKIKKKNKQTNLNWIHDTKLNNNWNLI